MAKNRENGSIFGGVVDLAKNAVKNVESKNNTQDTQHTQQTQSAQRKQKYPRINMAFYDDNLEYVKEAAYQARMSVTEYVNQLIVDDKNRKLIRKDDKPADQMSMDDL